MPRLFFLQTDPLPEIINVPSGDKKMQLDGLTAVSQGM
jgi:hypothetical protein